MPDDGNICLREKPMKVIALLSVTTQLLFFH